ncbi:MAG: L-seryl-tRNA(Sec) selenium transferase [Bryobacteraceae bacterium]|nr:L-seryl-tRNA(Sec) selenium transferase [Bryobacteraceae bacterium]
MTLRDLPSVDEVAQRLSPLLARYPRALLIGEIRRQIEIARSEIRKGAQTGPDIGGRVTAALEQLSSPSLRRVINATGVVLHTNLGRAPLAAFTPPAGYSNLEYDLRTGKRGKRDVHVGGLLEGLLGKPAIVANNNAAAVWLVLHEMAAGAEVVVSRGQLIEIGDGFRIPDIMVRAGVTLREVGTTNRTRIEDYRDAITERTRLLLIVHPSNFRIEGFTAQPERREIVELGRERGIPVYEDLGSGCMVDLSPWGVKEPLVQQALADGVQLVSFSGDKLLGGPQAGVIAGEAELVARLRRNPMFRAFRVDKLILQAMETTLRHLVLEQWDAIPALRMIRENAASIRARSEAFAGKLGAARASVVAGLSVIGGGSTPQQSLPTWRVRIEVDNVVEAERRLRSGDPAVVAMIEDGALMLDLRTVLPEEEHELAEAVRQ